MTTPDDPINEPSPIEPTNGAGMMPLDPDQSDVSQDPTPDLDEAEHAALLAMAGGLTAHQILTWEASQIGTGEHPPGSNHTEYSLWGDGPWCFYFQSYAFRHFGALDLIFGAHGYVPDFKSIFQPHGEFHPSNPQPGDLVAFDFNFSGEPEHIGMVEKVISGSVIQTIEGNTSNKVMRRTRSRSYVYGYATPKYGTIPTPTEDTLKTLVDLGATKAFTVPARPSGEGSGTRHSIAYDLEYSGGDPQNVHADGLNPSVFPTGGKAPYAVRADVQLTAQAVNQRLALEFCAYDRKSNDYVRTIVAEDFGGIDGGSRSKVLSMVVPLSQDYKYRVDLVNYSTAPVEATSAHLQIAH